MAAPPDALENEMSCPVCCDLYSDPVVLECSHSFCRACLDTYWKELVVKLCPVCRCPSITKRQTNNLVLRNIIETMRTRESMGGQAGAAGVERNQDTRRSEGRRSSEAERCQQHGERLLFYCMEDQMPLCVVCQTSRRHKDHQVCPVEEATEDLKEEMRSALIPLKKKLETFQKARIECKKTAEYIKIQNLQTERQIESDFEELLHFLVLEKKARLSAFTEEAEVKMMIIEEKIEHLAKKEASLLNTIRELEQEMETSDISFLQAFKSNKEKTKCTLPDPEPVSNALIDVATHLSNLKFNVWKKMMSTVQYTPVTFDPNTASPWLMLSDHLTSVRYHGDEPHVPDNPERFDKYVCVLGAEVFESGYHYWDVEVGDKTRWDLGVVRENVPRKGDVKINPENGFWAITLRDSGRYSACTMPWTALSLKKRPRKVRVCLDYDNGELSFHDDADMSLMYTFKCNFNDRLRAYFSPCVSDSGRNAKPLQICPAKLHVDHAIESAL